MNHKYLRKTAIVFFFLQQIIVHFTHTGNKKFINNLFLRQTITFKNKVVHNLDLSLKSKHITRNYEMVS